MEGCVEFAEGVDVAEVGEEEIAEDAVGGGVGALAAGLESGFAGAEQETPKVI